jgi:uncharacterized protein YgbK (DUF1537 family)
MGLRLVADDLTGALDAAARFVPACGPIPVFARAAPDPPPAHLALNAETRAREADIARAAAIRLAPLLATGAPAFRKLDSLLRGHAAVEIAASATLFRHVVIAPAFPYQGRITRGGRQYLRTDAGWRDCGVDLAGELAHLGVQATPRRPGQDVPEGVSLWDAAEDRDLDAIVAAGRALPGPVLWCGTAGLAGALTGRLPVPVPVLPRPLLGLIGSDQPVTRAQLAQLGARHHALADPHEAHALAAALARDGAAAVTAVLPPDLPRPLALGRILALFAGLLDELARARAPLGTLFVSGGETLAGLLAATGAARLDVDGELQPGVPTSLIRGGAWEGLRLVSKSGAFGDANFLARLMG